MSEATQPTARLRASLANAAFAVEDRVMIGGGGFVKGMRQLTERGRDWSERALDVARPAVDAAKWPFERLGWAVQSHLLWPLQDRTDEWSQRTRAAVGAGLGVAALGACALGLVLATGGSGSSSELTAAPAALPTPSPVPAPAPVEKAAPAPVLHGAAPVLAAKAGSDVAKKAGVATKGEGDASKQNAATATSGATAGPEALKVARRFADAFVLYEIGKGQGTAKAAFRATATPKLANALLSRPPRLPADVKVPKAKVLNVVAAPSRAGIFPISISLLRVGVTSELRLNMQKQSQAPAPSAGAAESSAGKNQGDQKDQGGQKEIWLVTDVTG